MKAATAILGCALISRAAVPVPKAARGMSFFAVSAGRGDGMANRPWQEGGNTWRIAAQALRRSCQEARKSAGGAGLSCGFAAG